MLHFASAGQAHVTESIYLYLLIYLYRISIYNYNLSIYLSIYLSILLCDTNHHPLTPFLLQCLLLVMLIRASCFRRQAARAAHLRSSSLSSHSAEEGSSPRTRRWACVAHRAVNSSSLHEPQGSDPSSPFLTLSLCSLPLTPPPISSLDGWTRRPSCSPLPSHLSLSLPTPPLPFTSPSSLPPFLLLPFGTGRQAVIRPGILFVGHVPGERKRESE
jgi:hypothetical protein